MSGVSVLVPTVNEAGNVDELLDRIHAAIECEVIVIDGESTDGTQEKVRARGDAKLVVQSGNQGGLTGAIL
ncbi:MAG: glycosyltransferase, partial [Planctomycetota bacterium]